MARVVGQLTISTHYLQINFMQGSDAYITGTQMHDTDL